MKNNKLIFMGVFLIVLAVGIFSIINLDSKKGSNKNDNNDDKTNIEDNDKDINNNNDNNIVNLNEVELGQEYQLICTYDADVGEYGTDTYQVVDTFYSNGTCRYEFLHTKVYNNVSNYNDAKDSWRNNEHFNECTNDIVFNDNDMSIKTIGGMNHCFLDGGESSCTDVQLNSTDELKEKIKPILEQNQTRNDVTCVLYKFSNNKENQINTSLELGGYKWHVIGDDGTNLTLLMDDYQLKSIGHLDSEYETYSWNKSKIRNYLNNEFYNTLSKDIQEKIVASNICTDSSILGSNSYSYGGYLESEIKSLGVTCNSGYVADKVRLMTLSEYYNLSPKITVDLPYTGSINSGNVGKVAKIDSINKAEDTSWLFYSNAMGGLGWTLTTAYSNSSENAASTVNSFVYSVGVDGTLYVDSGYVEYKLRPVITIKK